MLDSFGKAGETWGTLMLVQPRTPTRDFEAVLEGNVMSSDETWGAVASHLDVVH